MKGKTETRLCTVCQTNKAIVFLNEDGLPENEPICDECAEKLAWETNIFVLNALKRLLGLISKMYLYNPPKKKNLNSLKKPKK
ncbi:MAG: hypothetical protein RMJ34_07385 [candidate division WOR-3 bacterium]|nr:hypothetical protein [candidate division WOR-3 bacterium]